MLNSERYLLKGGPLDGELFDVEDVDAEIECFPFTRNDVTFWYCRNMDGEKVLEPWDTAECV